MCSKAKELFQYINLIVSSYHNLGSKNFKEIVQAASTGASIPIDKSAQRRSCNAQYWHFSQKRFFFGHQRANMNAQSGKQIFKFNNHWINLRCIYVLKWLCNLSAYLPIFTYLCSFLEVVRAEVTEFNFYFWQFPLKIAPNTLMTHHVIVTDLFCMELEPRLRTNRRNEVLSHKVSSHLCSVCVRGRKKGHEGSFNSNSGGQLN